MQECRCKYCNKKLGEVQAAINLEILCNRCKKLNNFTVKSIECLRATELVPMNEKTVSTNGNLHHA